MRITEDLLLPAENGPWGTIAKQYAMAYRHATGKPFEGILLEEAAMYVSGPTDVEDAVAWGFARKAVRRMRCTCPMCGSPAKRRTHLRQNTIRCAACQLPDAFLLELEGVLHTSVDASGKSKAVWPEHELPDLIRTSVPAHSWRQLTLHRSGVLRYLTAADIQMLTPWLTQLGTVLNAEAKERITRIAARYGDAQTKSGNGRPDEED